MEFFGRPCCSGFCGDLEVTGDAAEASRLINLFDRYSPEMALVVPPAALGHVATGVSRDQLDEPGSRQVAQVVGELRFPRLRKPRRHATPRLPVAGGGPGGSLSASSTLEKGRP